MEVHNEEVNLRELYPDIYKTDVFIEVSSEVQEVFLTDKRAEAARQRQMYNYKAYYSLDCDNGIEKQVVYQRRRQKCSWRKSSFENSSILR